MSVRFRFTVIKVNVEHDDGGSNLFEWIYVGPFRVSHSDVRKVRVDKRINDIVNRLNKTKVEEHPDFRDEREKRDAKEREDKKKIVREQKEKEKDEEKERKEKAELKSYASLMAAEKMTSNYDDGNDSDDFM